MKVPPNGLVLYAPLWHPELAGSPFISKDLNAHSCTVTGAIWTPQGRTFKGDDYIRVATFTGQPTGNAPFSAMGWVKFDSLAANGVMLSFGVDSASPTAYGIYYNNATNRLTTAFSAGNGACVSTNAPSTGVWYFIAGVSNSATNKIFVNGIEEQSVAYALGNLTAGVFAVGAWVQLGSKMSGTVGEAFTYNRALTPAEIMNKYLITRWRYV